MSQPIPIPVIVRVEGTKLAQIDQKEEGRTTCHKVKVEYPTQKCAIDLKLKVTVTIGFPVERREFFLCALSQELEL